MNRKSLILCFSALAAMLLAVVVAVAVLYHDTDRKPDVDARYELLQAVPSDAVALACLAQVKDAALPAFSGFGFLSDLSEAAAQGMFGTLEQAPMALSRAP